MDTTAEVLEQDAPKKVVGAAAWYGQKMAASDDWILQLGADDIEEID